MALIGYTITVVAKQDNPYNVLPETDISIRKNSDNTLVNIYADEAGLIPIAQLGAKTDSNGQFTFYADASLGVLKAVWTNGGVTSTEVLDSGDHSRLANRNAAGAHDASAIDRSKITVNCIKDLTIPLVNNQSFSVTGFYSGTTVGGGEFVWDANKDKSLHNGGTIIAPEAIAAWDGSPSDINTLWNWAGAGVGCFTLINNHTVHSSQFGFVSGNANTVLKKVAIASGINEIVFSTNFSTTENLNMGGKKVSSDTGRVVVTGSGVKNVVLSGVFKRTKPSFIMEQNPQIPEFSRDIKLLIKRNGVASFILQKNNTGYIRTVFQDGVFITTDSAGSPAQLMRATSVNSYYEVWVGQSAASSTSGASLTYETFDGNVYQRLSPKGNVTSGSFTRGSGLSRYFLTNNGHYVEYANVDVIGGVVTLVMQASPTSTFPVGFTVTVDGVTVPMPTITVSSPDGVNGLLFYKIPVEVSYATGASTRNIRVTHTGSNGVERVSVLGCNLFRLSELTQPLASANWFAAFADGVSYTATDGATDYAIFDSDDNQWVGSYHGGETRNSYRVEVDGNLYDYAGAVFEDFVMGSQIRIQQSTTIANKLNTYQYIDWSGFGGYTLQVSMSGSINCSKFYTCMATAHPRFNYLEYPSFKSTATYGDYDVGNDSNLVIQYGTAVNDVYDRRKQSNQFTFFKTGDNSYNGAHITANAFYNKLYYGPVVDGQANVNTIAFMNVKKFY